MQHAKHQVQLFPRGSRSRSRSRASESSGDIVRDSGAASLTDFRDADGGLRSSTVHNEGVRDAHLSPGGARQDMAAPLPHVALPLQCCQTVGVVTGATALPGGAGPGDVVRADGSRGDELHAAVGSPLGDVLSADARHPRPSVDLRHDLVAPDEVRPPVQSDAWGELGGPSVPCGGEIGMDGDGLRDDGVVSGRQLHPADPLRGLVAPGDVRPPIRPHAQAEPGEPAVPPSGDEP